MTNIIELLFQALLRQQFARQAGVPAEMLTAVDDGLVKDIVRDNLRSPPNERTPAFQCGVGEPVTTPNDGANWGWRDCPQIADWRPPGIEHIDRLVDQQDALDRAEREAKLKGGKP